jgi:hypothetical protein
MSVRARPLSPYLDIYRWRIGDHTYDVVVVGAGGAGLRATFGWPRRA